MRMIRISYVMKGQFLPMSAAKNMMGMMITDSKG